jgi:hypothetical protein
MALDKCTAGRASNWQVGLICRDCTMAWFGVVWGALAGFGRYPSTRCARSGERGGFDLRRGNGLMNLGHFGIFGDIGRGLRRRSGFVLRRRAGMLL